MRPVPTTVVSYQRSAHGPRVLAACTVLLAVVGCPAPPAPCNTDADCEILYACAYDDDGRGRCRPALPWLSRNTPPGAECRASMGSVLEEPERSCDGRDNDCNGFVDDVSGCVSTAASFGPPGYRDGPLADALFNSPAGMTLVDGILYVADLHNHVIRRVDIAGDSVTTIAGLGGHAGSADGDEATGRLNSPSGITASDDPDVFYVADTQNHRIRTLTHGDQGWRLTTLAGSVAGMQDGMGSQARFNLPFHLVFVDGALRVTDSVNCRIRRVTPAGVVTTLAGNTCGSPLNTVRGIAEGADGLLYFTEADGSAHAVNALLADGGIRRVVGFNDPSFFDTPDAGRPGFYQPQGIAAHAGGLYVADTLNNLVRHMAYDGTLSTLAGSREYGVADGPARSAAFGWPYSVVVRADDILVSGHRDHRIRVVDGTSVRVLTGGSAFQHVDGPRGENRMMGPVGLDFDERTGTLWVADVDNDVVQTLSRGGVLTTVAGTGRAGYRDAEAGQGLRHAEFDRPLDVALMDDGRVVVLEAAGRLREMDTRTGTVRTLVGAAGAACPFVDGPAGTASICAARRVAADGDGNIYFSEGATPHVIRRLSAAGTVSTFAGTAGMAGLNNTAGAVRFREPVGLTVGDDGWLYVADAGNHALRRVRLSDGVVETVGGDGSCNLQTGWCGVQGTTWMGGNLYVLSWGAGIARLNGTRLERVAGAGGEGWLDGPAMEAQFNGIADIAPSPVGGLYVSDKDNTRIRHIMP